MLRHKIVALINNKIFRYPNNKAPNSSDEFDLIEFLNKYNTGCEIVTETVSGVDNFYDTYGMRLCACCR